MTEADFVRLLSTANCISWPEIEAPITAKAPRSRDGAVVEGSHVAARLGLPVDRLRTEMRRGIVYSVVKRGMGGGAGGDA